MDNLTINPRFRDVTRPLKPDEYDLLEANILQDGRVYSPIITWNGQIVDGHNRWSIIQKHPELEGKYTIQEKEFADEWAVEAWICSTQLGRRNLTDEERMSMIGRQFKAEKKSVGGNGSNQHTNEQLAQNEPIAKISTAERIAKQHGVSRETVKRAEKFENGVELAETITPGAKEKILSGETKVPKTVIASLPKLDPDQQKEVVDKLMSGEVWKKKPEPPKPEPGLELEDAEKPLPDLSTVLDDFLEEEEEDDCNAALIFEEPESVKLPKKERLQEIESGADNIRDDSRPVELRIEDMLDMISYSGSDYISKVRGYLQEYSTVLDGTDKRKKVIAILEKTEAAIQKLKGVIL